MSETGSFSTTDITTEVIKRLFWLLLAFFYALVVAFWCFGLGLLGFYYSKNFSLWSWHFSEALLRDCALPTPQALSLLECIQWFWTGKPDSSEPVASMLKQSVSTDSKAPCGVIPTCWAPAGGGRRETLQNCRSTLLFTDSHYWLSLTFPVGDLFMVIVWCLIVQLSKFRLHFRYRGSFT